MKTTIFNLIILDESGSMYSIAKPAVDGVNETVQSIRAAQKKHPEQEHYVTLVTFNDEVKIVYDNVPVAEVRKLEQKDYQPECCTALYDAMGMSLSRLKKYVAECDKVLVTIVTDGYENSSKEYNASAIKALVESLKKRNWVFVYMGANQDVREVGDLLSISNVMEFDATTEGMTQVLNEQSMCRSAMYDRISSGSFCSERENKTFFRGDTDQLED